MSDRDEFIRKAGVSRETLARFDEYAAELTRWSRAINLVAPASLSHLWTRHFLDSIQLLDIAGLVDGRWADLGSGAGFPGLVCAIASEPGQSPYVHLIESDARKAAFLASVARLTETPVTIHARRIESVPPLGAAIVSARALAPLQTLIPLASRHLAPGGRLILPKGASWQQEIDVALETLSFTYEKHPSQTERDSVILVIGGIDNA
jgi:16S rRNA (guanine527-N7)-methyltransferase